MGRNGNVEIGQHCQLFDRGRFCQRRIDTTGFTAHDFTS